MFPLLYHAHHSQNTEDIPFWLDLAGQQPEPVLELGCGTGRVLLPLVQAGRRVYGLDNDIEMLAALLRHAPAASIPSLHIFQADLTRFHLAKHFGLILLPCNLYSTLSSVSRKQTLDCVLQHLSPNGILAVSIPNPSLLGRLPEQGPSEVETVFPHPLDSEPVQVTSSWKRSTEHLIIYWHYDHLLPDGRIQRLSVQTEHNLNPTQTYLDEMLAAGFKCLDQYGDFDGGIYNPNSPHLIIVASPKARRD